LSKAKVKKTVKRKKTKKVVAKHVSRVKKKPVKKKNIPTKKKKLGRPPKQFSQEVIDRISDLAFQGCQARTIGAIIDCDEDTLKRHFTPLLVKKRAERKEWLRRQQNKAAKASVPSMLIFLGKNDLNQTDKQDITSGGNAIAPPTLIIHDDRKKK